MTPEQIQPTVEELEKAKVDFDLCHKMLAKDCGFVAGINKGTLELINNLFTQAIEIAKGDKVVKCNLCHKDMIKLLDAHDMIKLLLPLAKGYVNANSGIRSTECIIEDAEAMIAVAEGE